MIKKYKTKPVVIEAVKWTGSNIKEVKEFVGKNLGAVLVIKTLEGDMRADKGDYIIKGLRGEFYPCKPDVFEKKYEEVEDEQNEYEKI